MIAALLDLLLKTTLAASAAILAVLAMRQLFRRLFGARIAYALWLLPPLAVLAVCLPAPRVPSIPVVAQEKVISLIASAEEPGALPIVADSDAKPWLALAWGLGAIVFCLEAWRRQRRFLRSLGTLVQHQDGTWRTGNTRPGPVALGVFNSRVVLPEDFEQRHDAVARGLILQHERTHLARRDPIANAVATAMCCLWWFNPLMHLAVSRFRFDQELAVDATVLSQQPQMRQIYARTLFDAQMQFQSDALACHWGAAHPLMLRIGLLGAAAPSGTQRVAGALCAGLLVCGLSFTAWAAQPASVVPVDDPGSDAPDISIAFTRSDGSVHRMQVPSAISGQWYAISDETTEMEFSIRTFEDGKAEIGGREVAVQGELVAIYLRHGQQGNDMKTPTILTERGSTATIRVNSGMGMMEWEFAVSQ